MCLGPSTIFSRKLFDGLGGFGEDFHYSMDTEYWWRIASSGFQFDRIPTYLWALRMHDGAKNRFCLHVFSYFSGDA
jgi:GT2 family glycosyltransferase